MKNYIIILFIILTVFMTGCDTTKKSNNKIKTTPLECFEYKEVSDGIAITNYTCGGETIRSYYDYFDEYENKVIKYDDGLEMNVVIPKKINGKNVVEISDYAFFVSCSKRDNYFNELDDKICDNIKNNTIIRSVVFPDTIERIGDYAFTGNFLEEEIKLPAALKKIGKLAFLNNREIKPIFNNNLEFIDDYAFADNNKYIKKITFPKSLRYIGKRAFASSAVDTVIFTGPIENIEEFAFYGNRITKLEFSDTTKITKISKYSFANNELTELNLPSSVTEIDEHSFASNNISKIETSSLEIIRTDALSFNNFTGTFQIPKTIKKMESFSVYDDYTGECPTTIIVPENVEQIDDWAFTKTRAINLQLTKIINKTGKKFKWEKIILGTSGSENMFEFGKVETESGTVYITAE